MMNTILVPILLSLSTLFGMVALVGLIHPRALGRANAVLNHTVDTQKLAARLDTNIDVDRYLSRYVRWLGVLTLMVMASLALTILTL